ncbi:hypothetical protein OICFNHDK_3569 [Methylobacterium bullatum]|uniref:Uncharacterized protein n=2 Tax=Methylobacterium bullatum TaxID=570505 RepID=A0AAV4ZAP9_9HYPH|nr:hypothetical protein OICFNHDK_3569 [Methylobacterium bullatum]
MLHRLYTAPASFVPAASSNGSVPVTVIPVFKRAGLLMSAAALLCTSGAAMAQNAQDRGLGGLFDALFSPSRPAVEAQQPAPAIESPQRSLTIRREANRPRPKIRYAALPKSEPLQLQIGDRQTPIPLSSGPMAALLKDPTLRPGDIVVLKDGARVFTGNEDKTHTARDFEPVSRSASVDRKTKALLSMMIAPVGALPPDEVRKFMARLKKAAPASDVNGAAQIQTVSMRVITP